MVPHWAAWMTWNGTNDERRRTGEEEPKEQQEPVTMLLPITKYHQCLSLRPCFSQALVALLEVQPILKPRDEDSRSHIRCDIMGINIHKRDPPNGRPSAFHQNRTWEKRKNAADSLTELSKTCNFSTFQMVTGESWRVPPLSSAWRCPGLETGFDSRKSRLQDFHRRSQRSAPTEKTTHSLTALVIQMLRKHPLKDSKQQSALAGCICFSKNAWQASTCWRWFSTDDFSGWWRITGMWSPSGIHLFDELCLHQPKINILGRGISTSSGWKVRKNSAEGAKGASARAEAFLWPYQCSAFEVKRQVRMLWCCWHAPKIIPPHTHTHIQATPTVSFTYTLLWYDTCIEMTCIGLDQLSELGKMDRVNGQLGRPQPNVMHRYPSLASAAPIWTFFRVGHPSKHLHSSHYAKDNRHISQAKPM